MKKNYKDVSAVTSDTLENDQGCTKVTQWCERMLQHQLLQNSSNSSCPVLPLCKGFLSRSHFIGLTSMPD